MKDIMQLANEANEQGRNEREITELNSITTRKKVSAVRKEKEPTLEQKCVYHWLNCLYGDFLRNRKGGERHANH